MEAYEHVSVMFRMYDTDKNGYLDQEEMNSIKDQMMIVVPHGVGDKQTETCEWTQAYVLKHTKDLSVDTIWEDGGDRLWQW